MARSMASSRIELVGAFRMVLDILGFLTHSARFTVKRSHFTIRIGRKSSLAEVGLIRTKYAWRDSPKRASVSDLAIRGSKPAASLNPTFRTISLQRDSSAFSWSIRARSYYESIRTNLPPRKGLLSSVNASIATTQALYQGEARELECSDLMNRLIQITGLALFLGSSVAFAV
jgi:hypothetical protein